MKLFKIIQYLTILSTLTACGIENEKMNRKQIESTVTELINADKSEERNIALEFSNKLRESNTEFSATLTTLDEGIPVDSHTFINSKKRVVILSIKDQVYLWQPKTPASVDVFYLE